MKVEGKYFFEIHDADGSLAKRGEAKNLVVNTGLGRISDLLSSNVFGTNYYPGFHRIDLTGMTVTNSGFTNPLNVIDGDSETYSAATVNNSSWDNIWWKIDFGSAKSIMGIYVDFEEGDFTYAADYKFQYSVDNITYYDFDVRFRPAAEDYVRSKVLFFVNVSPPFIPATNIRYIRLNTRTSNSQTFRFHEVKFYEPNFLYQPPCVMAVGTNYIAATVSDTALTNGFYKVVTNITRPSNNVTRFILDLEVSEANDANYWEVGLLFNGSNNYSVPTAFNSSSLFSRAIFDTVLTKSLGQTAQIIYELTVTNA